MKLIIPENYDPVLTVRETQEAIKYIRDSKEVAIVSFDPTKEAETAVQEFDKTVSEFLDEIDFTLSETNAVTTIEVI